MSDVFFQSVYTLENYQLEVLMGSGALIHFDFCTRLKTVRFSPLRDKSIKLLLRMQDNLKVLS